jgi:4-carboxymuconolactone decarboxylase
MDGIEPAEAGLVTRFAYWLMRRKFGQLTGKERLVEPIKIAAHHPRLFKTLGKMEAGLAAAKSVPAKIKQLASLQAAMLVGCPF